MRGRMWPTHEILVELRLYAHIPVDEEPAVTRQHRVARPRRPGRQLHARRVLRLCLANEKRLETYRRASEYSPEFARSERPGLHHESGRVDDDAVDDEGGAGEAGGAQADVLPHAEGR
jgi:hypothetical protein